MKINGYDPLSTIITNVKLRDRSSGNGKIICCGKAVCDISDEAQINLNQDLILGYNLRMGSRAESYLKIKGMGQLNVTEQFRVFFGASLEVFENGILTLGSGYINTGGAIACAKSVTLGNGVFIGRNTYITDSDHHRMYNRQNEIINEPQAVHIGDHVLIGFGAIVLKGVTIGDGAVIAAGAVVTQDVPAGCLAAGIPARVIREDVIWK